MMGGKQFVSGGLYLKSNVVLEIDVSAVLTRYPDERDKVIIEGCETLKCEVYKSGGF